MTPIAGFFACLALLFTMTGLTLAAVQRPLQSILNEICGAEHRARFWARFFSAMLLLAMLFCTLFALPPSTHATLTLHDIAIILRSGLFGVLAAMVLLALTMLTWQKRFEEGLTPPAPGAQHRAYRTAVAAEPRDLDGDDDDE